LAALANIGAFLWPIFLFVLTNLFTAWAARPSLPLPQPTSTAPRAQLLRHLRSFRRPVAAILAVVFGVVTIAMFAAAVQSSTVPLSTAYWYRNDLQKLEVLVKKWNTVTTNILDTYLQNKGSLPYDPNSDVNSIEANIIQMVQQDFAIKLNLTRHSKFDANPFYAAPNVERISKDSDKEEYRRLYDQYAQTKYTLNQVLEAYHQQILVQEDYIKQYVQKPTNCDYTENGNFRCP
jgi:hypothetical protein